DGTTVAEERHGGRSEGTIGKFLDGDPKRLGGRLQEIPVPGRALSVQLEVLDAPLAQDDELDVLSADVHDYVRVFVVLNGRLGVRDRFDQGRVSGQHVLEYVLRVSCRADAEHLQGRALGLDLVA